MADLALLEDMHAALRRERVFLDRRDLLMESDEWLLSRFRLPRHLLVQLCEDLEPQLRRETRRSHAIPVPVMVLSTLGFLATGTFQREISDRSGISQPTFSRTLPAVLAAIKSLSRRYIQFPFDDGQQSIIKREFYRIAEYPNVVGAIDCTHVRIKAPSTNDYAFINRKNYHSINVQIICDAKLTILNMVARWPGGTHDSFILQNSSVGIKLRDGALQGRSHLLGDKGYPLTEYLVTPLANPATEQERRFNTAHIRTRSTVERCIGLLKGRWLCLGSAGGALLYSPQKSCDIILASGVLHNIAQGNGVPDDVQMLLEERMPREPWLAQPHMRAVQRRQELVDRF
ncbi:hypothetical protein H4Q32_026559 [Labeo rohita]|uniref:Putative nuclease HARBI1 n=3 Tax=Labeonini TaxID=2743697 RepID=A0ABQ8LAE7_LABRO|nr:putative nuclease HARBI1 [Labeo rohita]XP_050959634.1 putative nuclease HARBI1 [Labeo rohita]KAI2646902.1 hypothetical protein H4Q32_026559 [Labeo rohita]